jgi:hypothetical protein
MLGLQRFEGRLMVVVLGAKRKKGNKGNDFLVRKQHRDKDISHRALSMGNFSIFDHGRSEF